MGQAAAERLPRRIALFANSDWYLFNFRRSLAEHLRAAGFEVILLSPDGPYGERLREAGFDWRAVPLRRTSLNPFAELAFVLWLARLFRRERPDLVHGFTLKPVVYGAIAARLAGVKARVSSVAGLGFVFINPRPTARALRPLVRLMLQFALAGGRSRLILQNADDVALFERQGLARPQHIRLIAGSGVDLARFTPPARDDRAGPVLMVARLLWDKGVAEFVEAARRLRGEGRNLRFAVAGDADPGNPAAVDAETLAQWKAEGVVDFLGHVEDAPALVRQASMVVLPSYREGLPKSLIEAAACARPLITTDAPGCRGVVTHQADGLLVPVRDAGALADAIARLDDDPALARRLGRAAREKAVREFDEAIVIARTVAVYDELLPP